MDDFDRYFAPGEFMFQTKDGTEVVRDTERIEAFFEIWDIELDSDGYLVDQLTGIRVAATDGNPIRANEVAVVSPDGDGGVELVREGTQPIIDRIHETHAKRNDVN